MSKHYICVKCKLPCRLSQPHRNVTNHIKQLLKLHNIHYNNDENIRIHKKCIKQLQPSQPDMKVGSLEFHAYIIIM